VELVKLLACCTMGKNVYTEIKCHSLLPLDDIVAVVSHPDCIPEVQCSVFVCVPTTACTLDARLSVKTSYIPKCLYTVEFL